MEHQFERTDAEFENRNSINKKRKRGRPFSDQDKLRRWKISQSYTDAEFANLEKQAAEHSLSESELIRRSILNIKITAISQISKDALVELNRIGNNINQIAKVANAHSQHHRF